MVCDQHQTGLRSFQERMVQTAAYEVGGLIIMTPLVAGATDFGMGESAIVVTVLTIVFIGWTLLHNCAFDLIEYKLGAGPASDRTQRWRLVHALSVEFTSIVISLPMLMIFGGLGFWEAVLVDVGLSLGYALYAYLFHLAFDRFWPVGG